MLAELQSFHLGVFVARELGGRFASSRVLFSLVGTGEPCSFGHIVTIDFETIKGIRVRTRTVAALQAHEPSVIILQACKASQVGDFCVQF